MSRNGVVALDLRGNAPGESEAASRHKVVGPASAFIRDLIRRPAGTR